jgi:hypothetical protein
VARAYHLAKLVECINIAASEESGPNVHNLHHFTFECCEPIVSRSVLAPMLERESN